MIEKNRLKKVLNLIMKKYLLLMIVAFMFSYGCVSPLRYMGKSYAATTNVDIYYSPHDIKKEYEVIGKVSNTGGNLQKIQNGILNEAKKRGADGIIYSDMQSTTEVVNGNSSSLGRLLNADFIKYK